jgi:bisanhydrobacterioruberin hydratase
LEINSKRLPGSKQLTHFLWLLYGIGFVGHVSDTLLPLALKFTSFIFLLTGVVILYFAFKEGDIKFLIWFLFSYIILFTSEILGVKTGIIFGDYLYSDFLGPAYFGVPLIISFNWIFILLGSVYIASLAVEKVSLQALLAGTIAVVYDMMLQAAVKKLLYWEWYEGIVPIWNYYSWFFLGALLAWLYQKLKIRLHDPIYFHFYLVNITLYTLLAIFL